MKTNTLVLSLIAVAAVAQLNAADESPIDFVKDIKPIFAQRCVECHNTDMVAGNLNLQNRVVAMKPRKEGAAIVPKQPDNSLLYIALIRPAKDKKSMPALSHSIPIEDVGKIRRWIREGANWPNGKDGAIAPPKKKAGDV